MGKITIEFIVQNVETLNFQGLNDPNIIIYNNQKNRDKNKYNITNENNEIHNKNSLDTVIDTQERKLK